jgi:HEAT repeat protein
MEKLKGLIAERYSWWDRLRPGILKKLGESGDPVWTPYLVDVLKTGRKRARKYAAEALGKIGSAEAIQPLAAALTDEHLPVREYAAAALTTIGSNRDEPLFAIPVAESLIPVLKESNPHVRKLAANILTKIGEPASIPLVRALKDTSAQVRLETARVLGEIGHNRAVLPLIAGLKDKRDDVRLELVKALGKIANPQTVKALGNSLKDKQETIRIEAAKALGVINDKGALKPLIAALKDESVNVQSEAADALGNIGDRRAVEPLVDILNNYGPVWDNGPPWRSVVTALGKLGETRAVKPLIYLASWHSTQAQDILDAIKEQIPLEDRDYYCKRCFCRAKEHKTAYTPYTVSYMDVSFYACRRCHSNFYLWENIKPVVMVLDRKMSESTLRDGDAFLVNGFKREEFFDYDEIWIRDADDFELEKLVLKLKNDMDDYRRSRLASTLVYISPAANVSPGRVNLLKDTFLVKIEER